MATAHQLSLLPEAVIHQRNSADRLARLIQEQICGTTSELQALAEGAGIGD
jgi:hypothetical protein